jgi:hypothetical protein
VTRWVPQRLGGTRRQDSSARVSRPFAVSQTAAVAGHDYMTEIPNSPDLLAIASEAQVEILVAETIQAGVMPDDAVHAFETAEIGYYEAELKSLRDAATTLNRAEQQSG